ncbi:glycosyltransferase family 4 protein [Conyzicola sp.]|uniref:glycosyltransferase family 4 protein n=1 Tax=Conyzicola sp. TaxID=1969404 RepID=UPI0039890411
MRVGLLYPNPDPVSPSNWSGTPHGLAGGLRANGVEVVPIGAKLPPIVHESVAVLSRIGGKRGAVAERTIVRQISRTRALGRRVAAAAPGLDAVVAMGLELFDLAAVKPAGVPFVTYDDGTLLQMWRNGDSDIRRAGFPEAEVHRWFDRQAASARAATYCAVSTAWAARSFVDDYGVPAERVRVVGMGHRPRASAAGERDWSHPRFLFIGVDWQRKNGDAVLRAFDAVRRSVPHATLDIVGVHPPIDLPGVRDHGFLPRDRPEAQAQLDTLFSTATAFVLPSRFDPSPIAYLEAASAGLPVIATTEGGAGELLGDAAISVHPADDAALVAAMMRLSDSGLARTMGARASAFAATASWEHVASRILQTLDPATAAVAPTRHKENL